MPVLHASSPQAFSFDFPTAWPSHVCTSSLTTAATRRSRPSRVLHSLAPGIWAVELPHPCQSCRLLEPPPRPRSPKGSRPEAWPEANPPKVPSRHKRVHEKRSKARAVKNDHQKKKKRADQRAIKKNGPKRSNRAFPLPWPNRSSIARHQTAHPRPITLMTAGPCSSSVAASIMAGMTAH